jgi:hypothetical protein
MPPINKAHQRLLNQHLAAAPFEKPVDVVDWLVAVQSQDYFGAKWALGLRLQDAHDADLDRAFNAGSILRTHVLRPTWHFVTPEDIRWLLALTAPRVHAANAAMYRKLELDNSTLKRGHKTMTKALQGGQHLTRDELRATLEKVGLAVGTGQRLAYIVMAAELDGLICSGPRRGKQFTYALLEERVPSIATLKRDEALATLSQRYFASHGPATVQDFAKWSGLTTADAKHGLEMVGAQLQHEALNGAEYWFSSSAVPINAKRAKFTAYLLSVFDEYLIGYADRSMIATPGIAAKLFTMGNALTAVVVVDGQIVGTWRRTLEKEAVVVTTDYWSRLTKAQLRAVAAAAQRHGEFLEKPVTLIGEQS